MNTIYKDFEIIYDDSALGHVCGWFYIPQLEKRSFSVQGCKKIISAYINSQKQ